jgi:hypothetical protein
MPLGGQVGEDDCMVSCMVAAVPNDLPGTHLFLSGYLTTFSASD